MKVRPNYITEIINDVNATLFHQNISDETNDLASWLVHYLLSNKCYRGYNYYKNCNGKPQMISFEEYKNNEYTCIQFH